MDFVVFGINHQTAPVEIRERVDFSKVSMTEALTRLGRHESVRSGMVLSTCNRVEVYAAGIGESELLHDAQRFLRDFHSLDLEDLGTFTYAKANREAVRHLFRVAASLDSMVVGEPQILGQVKEAYHASNAASLTDPFFDRLLRKAFSVAKRVRSETKVAEQAVSISYAAVGLAKQIFGTLEGREVMVLGAGQMAELAARHLAREKVKQLIFANRSYDHSVELAKEYNGVPVPFERYRDYLGRCDIILVSTAAPEPIIHKADVEPLLEERKSYPIFFIDISVPRNVAQDVNDLEGAFLYNIDDLQGIVDENMKTRADEARKAEEIVGLEVENFFAVVERLRYAPLIAELKERYDGLCRDEMERLQRKVGDLKPGSRDAIVRGFESITAKILSGPIDYLKGSSEGKREFDRAAILRRVFGLSPPAGDADDEES